MALKYVASNTIYDFGKSEYTTTSNKYKRLNYIANSKTYQIGLATDATATQYSPLKMKINDSTYYIGRSSSRSSSTSHTSTYSSRYLARVNTYTHSYTDSSIKTVYPYIVHEYFTTFSIFYESASSSWSYHSVFDASRSEYAATYSTGAYENMGTIQTTTKSHIVYYIPDYTAANTRTTTYAKSKIGSNYVYSTTTASSSTSSVTSVSSNNFV